MDVLIDYNNIQPNYRQRGVNYVIESVLESLPESLLPHGVDLAIRLYGGWYEASRLSRGAQMLSGEIAKHFPRNISLGTPGKPRIARVFVELARSLLLDPSRIIPDTYRVKQAPRNLGVKSVPFTGCVDEKKCSLLDTHHLFDSGQCPASGCFVGVPEIIERNEQKLVDTMLTVDLVWSASSQISDIVVVTSDDDFWPGIRTAIYSDVSVHHVHTFSGRRTPIHYSSSVRSNCFEYSI